eukprot:8302041-Pyramimonas_sp.AAC.3
MVPLRFQEDEEDGGGRRLLGDVHRGGRRVLGDVNHGELKLIPAVRYTAGANHKAAEAHRPKGVPDLKRKIRFRAGF